MSLTLLRVDNSNLVWTNEIVNWLADVACPLHSCPTKRTIQVLISQGSLGDYDINMMKSKMRWMWMPISWKRNSL